MPKTSSINFSGIIPMSIESGVDDINLSLLDKDIDPDIMITRTKKLSKIELQSDKNQRAVINIFSKTIPYFLGTTPCNMTVSYSKNHTTFKTMYDNHTFILEKYSENDLFDFVIYWKDNVFKRLMPEYKGYFKGYVLNMNPKYK